MANLGFFSEFAGYVPAATGQLISFIRDPKNYLINDYAQLVPTKKTVGVYHRLGVDQPVRVFNDEENIWSDGKKRPAHHENQLKYDTVEFQTKRRDYGFTIGWKTIEQADVNMLTAHAQSAQNQLMTARTNRAVTLLETVSQWGSNTDTASNLNGGAGTWDQGSSDPSHPSYLAIKKTLDTVARQVKLLTNGMVDNNGKKGMLKLLISPGLAQKMSQSPEIHDYIKQCQFAMAQIEGRVAGQNAIWGLPDQLYGWELLVEDAPIVKQRQNSSEAIGSEASASGLNPKRTFVKSDDKAVVLSRVGGLDGQYGAPSFSTLQIYYYGKELDVETFDEPKHRLTEGHCSEDVIEVIAAPASGFLIQGCL